MGSGVDSRLARSIAWAGFLTGTLLVGFWFCLWGLIRLILPENDLWWMIPTFQTMTEEREGLHKLIFLFSPWPIRLGQPVLKVMFFLQQEMGRYQLSHWAIVQAMVHLLNAILVFCLGRSLGFEKRTSWMAALIFLCFFPQFHAVLWPVAFQHLAAVTFLLAILCLWLKTESLDAQDPQRPFYRWATIGLALAGSLERSLLLLPLLMFGDFWLNSESGRLRRQRFEYWWPLFAVFLGYPLGAIAWVGDDRLTTVLAEMNMTPWARYAVALAAGLGVLFLVQWVLRVCERVRWERRLNLTAGLGMGVVAGFLYLRDHRQLLLPYNLLIPLMTCLGGFLEPIQSAFRMDEAEVFYAIPPEISPFLLALSTALVGGVLCTSSGSERRAVRFCILWYLLATLYPMFQYATYPIRIPSRYFVYLSPPFSLMLSLAAVRLLEGFENRLGWGQKLQRRGVEAAVVMLCLANLVAIRVAVWKGRLANNYMYYDDLRTIHLIREDRFRQGRENRPTVPVRICGVRPMPYEVRFWRFVPSDPGAYQLFKLLARQENYGLGTDIPLEVSDTSGYSKADYRVEGMRVTRHDGSVVGRFDALWEEGVAYFRRGDWGGARERLEAAVREKPFLLKFLLPEGSRLEEIGWLVGPHRGVRRWLDYVQEHQESATDLIPKIDRVHEVIKGELTRYVEGLFLLAYVENRLGRQKESRLLFQQTWWLEPDLGMLQEWLRRNAPVPWDASLEEFLIAVCQPGTFVNPLPSWKDGYGCERLLMQLLWHSGCDIMLASSNLIERNGLDAFMEV